MTTTTPKNETVETSENKALVTGDLFPDSAHKALLSMYSKELASR